MVPGDTVAALDQAEYIASTYTPPRRIASKGADKQVYIVGGSDNAVLYGVYALFHEVFGMRWLTPGVTWVPVLDDPLLEFRIQNRPEFSVREIGLLSLWREGVDEFRRGHGLFHQSLCSPGDLTYFNALLTEHSPDEAAAQTVIPYGTESGVQQMLQEIIALHASDDNQKEEALRQRKKAACWKMSEASVWLLAAMNWLKPVLSPEGALLNQREGTPAAAVIDMANQVAEKLAGTLPGETHWVHVLIPPGMHQPPRALRPNSQVIVHLSTAACNIAVPFDSRNSPENTAFKTALQGWRQLGARIHILDYLMNRKRPELPFPVTDILQSNVLFWAAQSVEGVHYAASAANSPDRADLPELKTYLAATLLYNPDIIAEECIEEFLNKYYGAAGPDIRQYLDRVQADRDLHGKALSLDDEGAWLQTETLQTALDLLLQAQARTLKEEEHIRMDAIVTGVKRLLEQRNL
jgi:hypothetical protein